MASIKKNEEIIKHPAVASDSFLSEHDTANKNVTAEHSEMTPDISTSPWPFYEIPEAPDIYSRQIE